MGWQLDKFIPAQTLDKLLDTMRSSYVQIPAWIDGCTSTASVRFLDGVYRALKNTITQANQLADQTTDVPNFLAYTEGQYGAGFDPVAEYQAWRRAALDITQWCEANNTGTVTSGQDVPTVDATPLVPLFNTLLSVSENGPA